jgi:hypothetical protein
MLSWVECYGRETLERSGLDPDQPCRRAEARLRDPAGHRARGWIARLESAGYIKPLEVEGKKKPYRITPSGTRALADEVEALRKVTATAARRLALR